MFTKRHYIAIAQTLGEYDNVPELQDALIRLFENDNPRFNSSRFVKFVESVRIARKRTILC